MLDKIQNEKNENGIEEEHFNQIMKYIRKYYLFGSN